MPSTKGKKWGLIALTALLLLVAGGAVGFRFATRILKDKVAEALGSGSEIQDIRVGWSGVVVRDLRIKGPQSWPAEDALRTEQVTIVPSFRSLLAGHIRVGTITIQKPYLSALRAKDGKLRIVPSLLEPPPSRGGGTPPAPVPPVSISKITLQDGVVELYDATVAQPPLKVRIEQLQATVRNIHVPALTGKSEFTVTGVLKGVHADGRIRIGGWAEVASKDSTVKTEIRGADLVALQPYLSKAAEVRVRTGTLDLDIQSEVRKNRLQAPGKITITNLELAPSQGVSDTFMGIPRGAVLAFLKSKDNRIAVNFVIEGDLNNPQFSVNEAFATRMAASMAETLGVSIRGVAEGVGSLGRKGVEAIGGTAKGIGGAIGGLFGIHKK